MVQFMGISLLITSPLFYSELKGKSDKIMKTLEELAIWETGQLPTILTKVILAEVEEAARARRFGRNLVKINEDLVRTKGRSMIFFRRGTLTAESVSEGTDAWLSAGGTILYTPYTLTVAKYAVAIKVTQEAIDGSNLDLIRDTIREAGIALADKEDAVILSALLGENSYATKETLALEDTGTFSLGQDAITYFSIPTQPANPRTFTVNYYTGVISSANTVGVEAMTVSYYYSVRTNFTDAMTEGTFSYGDIVNTANSVRSKKWSPDFMLISPHQMKDLLKSSQFVDFSKYGAREPLLRGEIGQISGMRVLVSNNMRQGNALVLASKRAAWLAIKRHVDLKRWDNPSTDSIELYFYMEYGAKVTDEDAIALLVGLDRLTVS